MEQRAVCESLHYNCQCLCSHFNYLNHSLGRNVQWMVHCWKYKTCITLHWNQKLVTYTLFWHPPPKKPKPFHYPDLSIQKHMSVSALFSNNLAVVVDYLTIQSLSVKNQFALSAKPKACQMLFFSYLFLNLIQVNYIFSDNKHNIIYLSYLLLATNFKGIFIWQSVIQVFLVEFYRIPFSLSHFPPVYCLVYVIGFMNMVNVQRKTWILMLSMNFKPWQKTAKD